MSRVLNLSPDRSFGFSVLSFDGWTRIYSCFALLALIPAIRGPEIGMDNRGPEKAEIQRLGLVITPAMVDPPWRWIVGVGRPSSSIPSWRTLDQKRGTSKFIFEGADCAGSLL